EGVRTHRTRRRIASTTWRGIPTIAVPEVLLEMAGTHSFDDLAYACHQARVLHHTEPQHVEAVLARHPTAKGAATLRAILHGDAPILLSRREKPSASSCATQQPPAPADQPPQRRPLRRLPLAPPRASARPTRAATSSAATPTATS